MRVNVGLKAVLRLLGKGESKVAAVFGISAGPCHVAVTHLKAGEPELPVWLFAVSPPDRETADLCERVYVNPNPWALFFRAQALLWKHWVAIAVATWTEERGRWPVKLAPFFLPPFHVLLLNRWGGFFRPSPRLLCLHLWRSAPLRRARDLSRGVWRLATYHLWRSGPVRRLRDVTAGAVIMAVSEVLGWFGNPHRRWFRRLHGHEGLNFAEFTPDNMDLTRFVQHGPIWDAPGLSETVQSSRFRWILWQQDTENSLFDPASVSALLDDPSTFAVAVQSEARGWKPSMLPMAPFRPLQPGMASRVLAPAAQTILVDRSKLAALGIPEVSLTQTAWMLLFWKAAAAGWRSYSVRGAGTVAWQNDFPLPEAEFFLRILFNRDLRRISPRDLDLARGTIAFAPAMQAVLRPGKLRVVLVSPFLPYPLSHGGAVRIFNLCRELADRVDFILIAVREAHDVVQFDEMRKFFRQIYTVDLDEPESNEDRLPRQVCKAQSASLRALISDVCASVQPDLLQIEFTHMAEYRECAPSIPALLVEHDLTFTLYRQLARTNPSEEATREYERWLTFERQWLARYEAVWTVSPDDRAAAIEEGASLRTAFCIPNGVDVRRFVPCEEPAAAPEVFYVGSFRHLPNILGFEKLRREVMPRIWERIPDARLRVVAGPEHERFWSTFASGGSRMDTDERIEMHDFVEDLRPLYARASAVVVPLEVSAGTNIKVLEAMACGKAVVTTRAGCAGLGLEDGEDALIRDDWEQFADAVSEALLDAGLRHGIGSRARRTAESRFSWSSIAAAAYSSYLALTASADEPGAQKAG